jgi:hypothetical protein
MHARAAASKSEFRPQMFARAIEVFQPCHPQQQEQQQ